MHLICMLCRSTRQSLGFILYIMHEDHTVTQPMCVLNLQAMHISVLHLSSPCFARCALGLIFEVLVEGFLQ